ncbi:helix-turn-helix domain-containing protein [Marinicella sp. W31]|uniref:helix-turn-helix domain-containing protein n=1 Tax=Marinicella sp. W31 TaxID=3023713 RepID=UPI0037568C3A
MFNIAILTHQNTPLFELGCAAELFMTNRPEIENWYQAEVISFENQPINVGHSSIQLLLKQVSSLRDYDFLIVTSWPVSHPHINSLLKQEVLALFARGGRIISLCSGAFLLAETGLLDQHKATTHWRYASDFKRRYPQVHYVDDHLYVYDGRIGCSAGSAAALDLGLQVIREDFGYHICNSIARRLVIPPHRQGGQSQFVEAPVVKHNNHFTETLDWANRNISKRIHVDDLAQKANMSRRTFDRKFRSSLNMSPKDWLIQQRLKQAQHFLETTSNSIETIASQSGFDNALTLRHHFRQRLGTSPSEYRKQFAAGTC